MDCHVVLNQARKDLFWTMELWQVVSTNTSSQKVVFSLTLCYSNTPSVWPISLITRCCSGISTKLFPALQLWDSGQLQPIRLWHPGQSGQPAIYHTLDVLTRLSCRWHATLHFLIVVQKALHSLQPPSQFVCLHRDVVVVVAEEEFQRCEANQWFASANSWEWREGENRGGEAKKENRKKKQIAVRFMSSRLSAAKKNRTEQTLASPRFIYTNAGSYKGNNSSCPTGLPNRIYCDFYLESNNLFPGGLFTKSSQNDDNTIPLRHFKKMVQREEAVELPFLLVNNESTILLSNWTAVSANRH